MDYTPQTFYAEPVVWAQVVSWDPPKKSATGYQPAETIYNVPETSGLFGKRDVSVLSKNVHPQKQQETVLPSRSDSGHKVFHAPPQGLLDKTATQRVQLLATKYAAKDGATAELVARLEILNRRLEQLQPQVNAAQVERLEQNIALVEQVRSAKARRAAARQAA